MHCCSLKVARKEEYNEDDALLSRFGEEGSYYLSLVSVLRLETNDYQRSRLRNFLSTQGRRHALGEMGRRAGITVFRRLVCPRCY